MTTTVNFYAFNGDDVTSKTVTFPTSYISTRVVLSPTIDMRNAKVISIGFEVPSFEVFVDLYQLYQCECYPKSQCEFKPQLLVYDGTEHTLNNHDAIAIAISLMDVYESANKNPHKVDMRSHIMLFQNNERFVADFRSQALKPEELLGDTEFMQHFISGKEITRIDVGIDTDDILDYYGDHTWWYRSTIPEDHPDIHPMSITFTQDDETKCIKVGNCMACLIGGRLIKYWMVENLTKCIREINVLPPVLKDMEKKVKDECSVNLIFYDDDGHTRCNSFKSRIYPIYGYKIVHADIGVSFNSSQQVSNNISWKFRKVEGDICELNTARLDLGNSQVVITDAKKVNDILTILLEGGI